MNPYGMRVSIFDVLVSFSNLFRVILRGCVSSSTCVTGVGLSPCPSSFMVASYWAEMSSYFSFSPIQAPSRSLISS